MTSCWISPCPGGACIMYLALVFEISYSGRKIQKSVAWIIAPHFLEQAVIWEFHSSCPRLILVAKSKSGEICHENRLFPPFSGEYRSSFVLEKERTSLRKSTSPP